MSSVSRLVKRTNAIIKLHGLSEIGPKDIICSKNTKTGYSINFPIKGTCRPTKVCAENCYGAIQGKPITWTASLLKQSKILKYFKSTNPEEIADRIHKEYVKKHMTFLRWNGIGDLFKESVNVINIILNKYPNDILWVVTRIPEFAAKINRKAQNVYIMFSLDSDPESKRRKIKMMRHRHPRIYYSYLRFKSDENTMKARIVFNAQQEKKNLPYDDLYTVCPVDAGIIPVKNACENCRKCFTQTALDKRKEISERKQKYEN